MSSKTSTSRRARANRPQTASNLATELEFVRHVDDTENKWLTRLDDTAARFEKVTTELRENATSDHNYLNQRITTVESNLSTKIEQETANLKTHIDTSIEKLGDRWDKKFETVDKRITVLEQWRWIIIGGAAVVLFLLSEYVFNSAILNWFLHKS